MKVTMIKCDNPSCRKTDIPEDEKGNRPPYGWLTVRGGWFGCGPDFSVVVHDIGCLVPAIEEQAREAAEAGR
jgi:hypothetical protein